MILLLVIFANNHSLSLRLGSGEQFQGGEWLHHPAGSGAAFDASDWVSPAELTAQLVVTQATGVPQKWIVEYYK